MKAQGVPAVALLVLAACASAPPVERRGAPQVQIISRSYPADLPTLRTSILYLFSERRDVLSPPFDRMQAMEFTMANWVDPGGFLAPYAGLAETERVHDLLIEDATGDVWWPSEYTRFRCGFILHLREAGPFATEVQVFEKAPEVWAGERWAFSRHGPGFGKVRDIRFVEPTVKDRLELLDLLTAAATGGR